MKLTPSLRKEDAKSEWFVVDATNIPLGRLASEVASRLKGKHKTSFTPHVDGGDNIIIINAEKVRLTGRKAVQEKFFWHTGHPGGIKEISMEHELAGNFPGRVVERGVQRMLPKTKLGRQMFKKLHVYAGDAHPHAAQKPAQLDVAALVAKSN